ncbi:myosin II heavy chain [Cryptosporidium ryanae]|uniref:myosin II heavy chain n=1 Tax=Cryptosporidium ryanae TaxID=515981 RepID=UPI003519E675|nr:myosin II heavy chain [Cryptosporidium ryanae]
MTIYSEERNEEDVLDSGFSNSSINNLNSGIGVGVSVVRKKTRKAIRPGVIENNSINTASKGLSRPSIINRTESVTVSNTNRNSVKKIDSQFNTIKRKQNNLGEACLKSESQIRSSVVRKSFKEDNENDSNRDTCSAEMLSENENKLRDLNNDDLGNNDHEDKQENTCPFLVGSGSEASYEKSSEANIVNVEYRYKNIDIFDIINDKCLLEMVSEMSIHDCSEGSLIYRLSNDIDELSKYFTNMIGKLETFGLNIQSKLERLEGELEVDNNVKSCVFENEIAKQGNEFDNNYNDVRYKKYNYLLEVKNRLLKELSEVEKELIEEQVRINKEESERLIRIESYKSKKKVYKDELTSLTVIICWIEDSLQNYIYPLQKKQMEYKQELSREREVLSLIKEELSKIEKQEKIVFDKVREIQDSKRYIGEEKELLQEQIRISKNSKTEKIRNGNFKEASLITQTINVLEKEVSQIEENYLNILNQEKEFIEKIDRIKRNYNNELKRMDECRKELILSRKFKRGELREKLYELRNCEFSINNSVNFLNTEGKNEHGTKSNNDANNSDYISSNVQDYPDSITKIFENLSSQFKSQTNSVLGYEIALLESQENEDDATLCLLEYDQEKTNEKQVDENQVIHSHDDNKNDIIKETDNTKLSLSLNTTNLNEKEVNENLQTPNEKEQ